MEEEGKLRLRVYSRRPVKKKRIFLHFSIEFLFLFLKVINREV